MMEKMPPIDASAQPLNPVEQFIHSLQSEGLVSEELKEVYELKKESSPHFFRDLIIDFCRNAEDVIGELTQAMQQPTLNFYDLGEIGFKLKGMTKCVGARCVAIPSTEFLNAAQDQSTGRCYALVEVIRSEYLNLRGKLYPLVQLEHNMITSGTSGNK